MYILGQIVSVGDPTRKYTNKVKIGQGYVLIEQFTTSLLSHVCIEVETVSDVDHV